MKFFKIFIITICLLFGGLVKTYSQNIETISSTVEFVVNTNNFITNENYTRYVDEIVPIIKENSNNIDYILLIGSASPEGNKQANIRLANIRADRIYSYIKMYVPKSKIIINNNYELFLDKTGLDESDYTKLRATYIEVHFKQSPKIETRTDTVYKEIEKIDTVYIDNIIRDTVKIKEVIEKIDTVYTNKSIEKSCGKLVFSPYNNLATDLIKAPGIGLEFYFHQMSFFVEGNFANTTLTGKKFTYDLWHTGFRKYFNDDYDKIFIEVYGRTGYFDMDIFEEEPGKFGVPFGVGFGLGWKFSLCSHIKLYPLVRFGYDHIKFMDYYYTETGVGTVGVTFNQYTDYKDNTPEKTNNTVIEYTPENRVINREFFEKAKTLHWFGPTYAGLVIQLDLHNKK